MFEQLFRCDDYDLDSDVFEDAGQLVELGGAEAGEGGADGVADGPFEAAEGGEAGWGDVGADDAAILNASVAFDVPEFLHTVEEAGDVGVASDQAFGDFAAGESGGTGVGEDTKDVVLRVSEAEGTEGLLDGAHEPTGGTLEIEEGLVGRVGEGAGLANFGLEAAGHTVQYSCCNEYRQRHYTILSREVKLTKDWESIAFFGYED